MERNREIGARIRAQREKAGRSVEWLAERLRVHRRTILNIEAGNSGISLHDADVICESLGCRLGDISSAGRANGKKKAEPAKAR